MKFKIFHFESVTSTNDMAMKLIKKNKKISGCVYAKKQTKGKGTRGKKWISEIGNLFSTFFFPLKKKYPTFSEFSLINPIIVSNVINKFCKNKTISFKWPNDILLNKRKICGILQEVITVNKKKFLIIGIGINIISNPVIKNKYKATNIFLETKKNPTTKELINLLIISYEDFFKNLDSYNFKNFKRKTELMAINE